MEPRAPSHFIGTPSLPAGVVGRKSATFLRTPVPTIVVILRLLLVRCTLGMAEMSCSRVPTIVVIMRLLLVLCTLGMAEMSCARVLTIVGVLHIAGNLREEGVGRCVCVCKGCKGVGGTILLYMSRLAAVDSLGTCTWSEFMQGFLNIIFRWQAGRLRGAARHAQLQL